MNDFTKDELEWLNHEVNIIINNPEHIHTISKPISEKIKYMCDHLDLQEKTASKFFEWQKQLSEQKNE